MATTLRPFGARRRASSTVRAVVIALSTFAILLVCFSLYQYSQLGRSTLTPRDRLPKTRTDFADLPSADELQKSSGVKVDSAIIGKAQGISLTIYGGPNRTEAIGELTMGDYLPKPGVERGVLLQEPVFRMRSKAGNDIRISAPKGDIDGLQDIGRIAASRGRLAGGVLIEIDRRTSEDKAALPQAERDVLDPAALVRIEAEELEFDLEYDKLIIPSRVPAELPSVTVRANDAQVDFWGDVEIRFNQAESRVESMRVARGGRIELTGGGDNYGLEIPGAASGDELTLVEWLRKTIKARMAQEQGQTAQSEAVAAEEKVAKAKAPITYTADGVPVFRPSARAQEPEEDDSAIAYRARFEGKVDGRQEVDGKAQAQLTAEVLKVRREFSRKQRGPAAKQASAKAAPKPADAASGEQSSERLMLTWAGPLLVESLPKHTGEEEARTRSRIEATGAPARLAGPDGEVVCAALTYEPDAGIARFTGTEDEPAVVRSVRDGEMHGRNIALRMEGERFFIDVEGPGRVRGEVASVGAAGQDKQTVAAKDGGAAITFKNALHAAGRIVEELRPDFPNVTLRRSKTRVLETMTADGRVRAVEKGGSLATDQLEARFGRQKRLGDDKLFVEHVLARGNTVLQDRENRMDSRELEVRLAAGATGKSLPVQAIARGSVSATQGDRVLKADDELIMDFERVLSTKKLQIAQDELRNPGALADEPPVAAGSPPSPLPLSLEARGVDAASQPFSVEEKAVAKTMRARGNVTVQGRGLDLAADNVTCSIKDEDIEQALISGTDHSPATARLDTFAVMGATIRVHKPDEWAEVPGEGRMTIRSYKDLNGKKLDEPIPIAVTWTESMGYRGRENVAHFRGNVHASSETGVTFDCNELRTEFIVKQPEAAPAAEMRWGFFQPIVDQLVEWQGSHSETAVTEKLKREPSSIYASGDVVLQRSNLDPAGNLTTRARIAGPKLSLNLRDEVSRALIEGAGTLQLEDFATPDDSGARRPSRGLSFDAAGPSKTLVQWTGRMLYDFSINQVRFEEGVDLRHLSGQQLEKFFKVADRTVRTEEGLASFLTSDLLVLDFEEGEAAAQPELGRLDSNRIREFRAQGNVRFQDDAKRLSIEATEIIYVKARQVLIISGAAKRKARIVLHRDGGLPTQMSVDRAFINLATDPPEIELAAPFGIQGG